MNERDRILLHCSAGSKSLRCGQPDNVHPYAIHDNPNSEHSIMMKAIKRLFKIEPELVMNQMMMPCCNEFELLSMTVGRPWQTLEQRWRVTLTAMNENRTNTKYGVCRLLLRPFLTASYNGSYSSPYSQHSELSFSGDDIQLQDLPNSMNEYEPLDKRFRLHVSPLLSQP